MLYKAGQASCPVMKMHIEKICVHLIKNCVCSRSPNLETYEDWILKNYLVLKYDFGNFTAKGKIAR